MHHLCYGLCESLLGEAFGRVFLVFLQDFVDFGAIVVRVELHQVLDRGVGLVEPELVEVENRGGVGGFGGGGARSGFRGGRGGRIAGGEPDGVTFGFAEFAPALWVDYQRGTLSVGLGVFEATDEVDARGAVAVLVGATELEGDAILAIEMKEVVALDSGVAELGVRDAGTAFTHARLDEFAVH